ncbi:hypothetical protein [Desulfosarcina sp.]|uniref:hypothetical protein n=1 Tax=Desulfosarcina sp. TaxID=2027861 RepID=UPI00356AC08F
MKNKEIERAAPRNATEAAITCRPFSSTCEICVSDGVMRNFSSQGSYIETSHKFESGTILIMRIVLYPSIPSFVADQERPRSICLAEVKWWHRLAGEKATRYGIGLRYLG